MDIQLDEAAIRALTGHRAVHKAVVDTAEQGRDFARSIAPVDTGRYRDSIEVRKDGDEAEIVSELDYAPHIEHGTRHMPGQHIFGRTLDSLRSSGQP
ncbi:MULTISPECIES: HK97 gp10 family phage protein [Streptomyces]|uniref:HK97 gp10 family phage protein n=1 Tax=Streptomyces apricus TaxID=1828112 RepID=A0A5B0BJL5_9ACTN|nr:HK97 gp10 family phage protein [Streptomyces apricus]KAA0941846.1 HK97 gp10 family phage protein [Streptomyces apricus]